MTNIDLLSIGDATFDVFLSPTESEMLCNLDDKDCFICFSYGDKIPVDRLEFSVGGNAANNVVGTRRLGVNSALIATLGDDNVGKQIMEALQKEVVDISFVIQSASVRSSYSTVINYGGERTIFTFQSPKDYVFPQEMPLVSWLYLTSMADNFRDMYAQVSTWVKDHPDTKLAFNPGSRQLRAGTEALKNVLVVTSLIYVNREEAEKLTDFGQSQGKEKDLLKALSGLGPKMVIITDGGKGSFAYDGEKYLKAGVVPIDAHERTGAGDAFGSGCLSALIKEKPLKEALLWGTVNSASVIGYTGSQKGLLKESEIPAWLERAVSCGTVVEEI